MASQASVDVVTSLLTPALLKDRARALLPAVAAARDAIDAGRDLPADLVAAMRGAGLFRSFQPARWGGAQLDPGDVLEIQNQFAAVCASTAWIYGVLSVQAFLLARFDPRAQADVWGADPETLVSSSFQPVGKVVPVDGGFRLSGRFTFSSGSSHCGWALLGGIVPPGVGRETPEVRLFLVPRSDYRIDDVWHVIGLKGTGSNDIVVADAFVPAYRTHLLDSGLLPLAAASGLPELYRLPWMHVFTSMVSNLGTGMLRGAAALFTEATRTRVAGYTNAAARENPVYVAAIARAHGEADVAEQTARRNFDRLAQHIAANEPVSLSEALLYRSQITGSMRRLAGLIDELMLLLGARGIRADAPMTRIWLDAAAARAHVGNDPAAALGLLGNEILAAE